MTLGYRKCQSVQRWPRWVDAIPCQKSIGGLVFRNMYHGGPERQECPALGGHAGNIRVRVFIAVLGMCWLSRPKK